MVVQIEPLDKERLIRFVAGRGIANPKAFIDALDEHSAWDFVGRPLDALDLLEFWVSRGRLGTLSEIIENDVTQKMKETTLRLGANSLSEEKARSGAETLGAAAVFCKRQQFKVLDDSFVSANALDAPKCLPADWTQEDCNALLMRPIFDSAAYGQIRFHHRRIAEYLAAKWLESRMAEGCPRHVLEQFLFSSEGGKRVLRQSTAPIAAWLCVGDKPWNDDVRSWVLDAALEIHLVA